MKKLLLIGVLVLAATSCETMQKMNQERFCNYNGAYEQGVNDAQNGKQMNAIPYTMDCVGASKDEATKGYREGFMTIKTAPVISTNQNNVPKACHADIGKEAHESFCNRMNEFSCKAHAICVYR